MRHSAVFVTPLFVTVLGIALSLQAAAEIYRWTDENGRTHFSDKPPRDRQAENISQKVDSVNLDSSGEERKKLNRLFAPETPEEKERRLQRKQAEASERERQQQLCAQAREELRFFREERFYWVDEQGGASNASEEERQQVVTGLTDAIQRHCR